MQNRRVRLSRAKIRVLELGTQKGYSSILIPKPQTLLGDDKRIFTSQVLSSMVKDGLVRYQPARLYVTGKGRTALKQWRKKHANS